MSLLFRLRANLIDWLLHHVPGRDIGQIKVFIDLIEELQVSLVFIQDIVNDLIACEAIEVLSDTTFGEVDIQP